MQLQDKANPARNRLTRVFQFLRALHEMRNPVQREVTEQPWTLWFHDLPDHPTIRRGTLPSPANSDDEEGDESVETGGSGADHASFILAVRRPELTAPPKPPAELERWLEPGWESPENDRVAVREPWTETRAGVEETFTFEDDPQRVQMLEEWLEKRREWLGRERPARKAMTVFEALYALRAMLERESERLELMLGDGLLVWNRSDLPIHHPVLLQRLQLVFDPALPEFRLIETEHPPELYTALFRALGDVSAQGVSRLRDDLAKNSWHPLGGDDTSAFLKRVVTELSPLDGKFIGDGPSAGHGDAARIGRDPVAFLRLKTLGLGTAIDSVLEDLPTRTDFPGGLTGIVGIEPGEWGASADREDSRQNDEEDESILLSKQANADQLEIARRLERFGAVLVQGPPGTGKTHTIANLLGHLLAQGKSVLVTAHKTKALTVLRDYVVEPLRPLCVSVLDGTSKQLEDSVEEISARLSDSDEAYLECQANALQVRRENILRELRGTRERLLQARGSEYRPVIVAGSEYAPSQAARLVGAGTAAHSWIPSPVVLGVSLPLSVGEVSDLYHTNEVLTYQEQEELSLGLPDPQSLLTPSEFSQLCETRSRLASEQLDFRTDLWDEGQPRGGASGLEAFTERVLRAVQVLGEDEPWRLSMIAAGREGGPRRQVWEELLAEIEAVYFKATTYQPLLVRLAPFVPEDCLPGRLRSVLEHMEQHLRRGGGLGVGQLLLHGDWRTILRAARVNGKAPRLAEHLQALKASVELREARARLRERWDRQVSTLGGPTSESFGREPEEACRQFVPIIQKALDWIADTWLPLERELRQQGLRWDVLLGEVPPDLSQHGNLLRLRSAAVDYLPGVVAAEVARRELQATENQLKELNARLDTSGGGEADAPTLRQLREAVKTLRPEAYREAFERLVSLQARQGFIGLRRDLLARLEPVAPAWAAAVRNRDGVHGGGAPPGKPLEAWTWRQLSDELDHRASTSLEELQVRGEQLRTQLLAVTAELIEKRTWAAQARRTTLHQRQALNGWKALITKAGKRTGKRAPRLLAQARKLIPVCQSAVPVWIMPLSQVFDNFDPRRNRFDVVIIDEASQADVMALVTLYMGRQVIVVGDHQQVTPDAVGQRMDEVQQLIDTHLEGIPNRQLYDGQTSIYDLAKTAFGGTVMLHEHFRCVPDIIEFSNNLSYNQKIQPLRDPSTVHRRPHTIAYRVNGVGTDSNTNEVEAATIASLLIAAAEQPEYADATFGVISLVGAEQAARIDLLLQRSLSPGEYHRRRVQCGNAAQFQGDERDVIFLSMVYSPSGNGPLRLVPDPGERIKKRFNVAASRARDQLWVVHSVDPENDLQPEDLRRRLIVHARDPKAVEVSLEHLKPHTESELERGVLQRLLSEGYRVTPQWRVGPYRIDFVVEDGTRRLAVECDGDRYHPPEKLRDDMARQAVLERMGWRFVRIRGSKFFRDPGEAMEPVLTRLKSLGVRPIGHTPAEELPDAQGNGLKDRVVRRADEIRREWNGGDDVLVWATRHRQGGGTAGGNPCRGAAAEQQPSQHGSPLPDHEPGAALGPARQEPRSLPTVLSKPSTPPPEPRPEQGPRGPRSSNPETGPAGPKQPLATGSDQPKPSSLPSTAPRPSGNGGRSLSRDSDGLDVVELLRLRKLEVIDKRPAGGALWVVGGWELSELLGGLKARGLAFHFAKNGGRASKNRPAWFAK